MKSCILSFFIASVTCIAVATEFGDMAIFLPFLRSIKPPPNCPPNELYKTCTGNCSDCTLRGMCPVTTCIEGCDCAPHFFRVKPGGPCEPVANCPRPECGENEVFRACGPICERCTTYKCRSMSCEHKCYCKEGYLRNTEHACIPEQECPVRQRCSHSEEWAESGPVNEFCLHGANDGFNETQNVPQCYCKKGYKRNTLGICANETYCSSVRCLSNEVYRDCIPKCNTTCKNHGDPNCTEDENCYPGCFCKPGEVMNDFMACIPVETCSLEMTQLKVVSQSFIAEEEKSSDSENVTESSTRVSTYTSDTTEQPGTDGTSVVPEDNPEDSEEISTRDDESSSHSDMPTTESPVPSSTAGVKPPKRKTGKMRDSNARSSNHAYAAASSKASKQETPKDEKDFDNEEI